MKPAIQHGWCIFLEHHPRVSMNISRTSNRMRCYNFFDTGNEFNLVECVYYLESTSTTTTPACSSKMFASTDDNNYEDEKYDEGHKSNNVDAKNCDKQQ